MGRWGQGFMHFTNFREWGGMWVASAVLQTWGSQGAEGGGEEGAEQF